MRNTNILLLIILSGFLSSAIGYLLIVHERTETGAILFNSSVYKLGSDRHYKINAHKSANFIHHLLHVDRNNGQIVLKKPLKCDGIWYPNLFTFYIDSTSSRLRNINYYSLPLRVLVVGNNCTDYRYLHYDEDDARSSRRRREVIRESDTETEYNQDSYIIANTNVSMSNYNSFQDGDILFDSIQSKKYRHEILIRKRRFIDLYDNGNENVHRKIQDARQWISETFASYPIHTTDKWNRICLKQSQFVHSLTSFLPRSIHQYCKVKFIDVSDERFKIEPHSGDLVASNDLCISESIWKITITFNVKCENIGIIDADHRLKIVYHHQEFNDTDIAKRVKRELRNQSPYFEQALYVASALEEQPQGLAVTTVKARDPENSPVVYSMTSILDSRSQSMFNLDSRSGVIQTATRLDRELIDVHYFRVVATDDSFPPRSGTTTLQINILDCNDHAPTFEFEQFEASIREGSTIGTTFITVRATDQDIGRNSEIEYSIENITDNTGLILTEEYDQIFKIDSKTGAITTRATSLDREKSESYSIFVKATDMALLQSERKSASTTVLVTVLDDNDNYPQFSEKTYTIQLSEDYWTDNNVVAHITATDADLGNNAAIRYAIIGGNTQSQFSIDSMNGDVTLVKPLDYENIRSYRLVIRAQDGGIPSRSNTTQLLINVLDANDNAPRFYTTQFQEVVLESVPVGYNIVRVQAYDQDEGQNSEISYSIQETNNNFPLAVDSRTGWIHTTKILDREEQSLYKFQVIAVDGGIVPKSASSSVVITIQDVNDNDPTFSPKYYEATISEDQSPGTPITTVIATDPDEDSRLHYEITNGNTRGRFSITSQNGRGLITIAQTLDYKQEKRFILTVTATDSGGRTDTATVNINITDANNYAPSFENAPYSAQIIEDAPFGTTILVVSATDNDVGINAQITFSLTMETSNMIGSQEPFIINPQTGAIITNARLDRETTSSYLLTVTAKDGGNPSLSDSTDVEISLIDVNDNAPVFNIPLYQASIPEDALIGTSVINIEASDMDIGLNGRIKYLLSSKDILDGSFVVDQTSGIIRTNKGLDRESIAIYHLIAIAEDRGTPPLRSTIEVQIRLEDVNDSPPTFPSDKITLYVPENSPVGSIVGEIYAHDPDEGINAIVQYSIIGGDDSNAFSLITRPGSSKAHLLTMIELDYESTKKKFELVIRATSPPLRNDAHVEIMVTDVNDNAPILKDFQVIFNNFRDCFPGGIIGRIPAFDADVSDNLTYRILSGNNANLVKLNATTGALILSPQLNTNVPKFATMEVSVSDGINEAKAVMQLTVRLVTEDMLFNSVTIRLNEMTAEAFLSPLLNFFLDGLSAIIPCPKEYIYIFSIQDDIDVNSRILNVSFSAKRPDVTTDEYYSPQYIQERVYLNRGILGRLATVQVLPFDDNLCVREPCLNYEHCLSVLKFGNASGFVNSDTVLFRPIYPVNTFVCKCPNGFTGSKELYLCDTEVDLCYSNPCLNGGSCLRNEGGFTCSCLPTYTGKNCETLLSSLKPCTKENCDGGFLCMATLGSVHSQNVQYTSSCELRSRSFSRNSFLTFPSLRQRHRFNIKMRFATIRDNGLLLYNGRYNEQHDFIALEIVNGKIMFTFSLGDQTKSVIIQEKEISDGQWHSVEINYFNRTALLSLNDCDTSLALRNLGSKWNCANLTTLVLDRKCASVTAPCHRFLDLTGPLQIGGLPTIPTNFQTQSHDFVGCISDVYLDSKYLDLNSFVADNGTVAGCIQKLSFCASEPCFNGGTCNEGWETFYCECSEGFTGNACQEEIALPWRFNGDGILSFNPLLRPIQLPWIIALSIRTQQKNSFLMQIQIGQNSSAILSLQDGILYYTFNSETTFLTGINLADGIWHRIEIKWVGTELLFTLDYGQRTSILPVYQKIQGLYVGRITIGGYDGIIGNLYDYNYFEGCIQDVRVGGPQSLLNRPTKRENVLDGCASNAECPDSCPLPSKCILNWDEAHCECIHGYVGDDCLPVCATVPCSGSGVCRTDLNNKKGYVCECNSTMHSGEYCEHEAQQPCPSGWWGEKSCGPCSCNTKQGYNPNCDKKTGQCFCKDNHFQPQNDTVCHNCDCYTIGSYGRSCNMTSGQCECREGVIGRRCDSCSNPYAEVTLNGCEVVYDACPKSFSAGIWWKRTSFGETAVENCPYPAYGKGIRHCDSNKGEWKTSDLFNCTSQPFLELRKQLSLLEQEELQLNSFLSIKIAANLQYACTKVKKDIDYSKDIYLIEPPTSKNQYWQSDELEFDYLSDFHSSQSEKLYGADLLVTERLLHELINHEIIQTGLNLTHSQDKHFIKNLVNSASTILDERYNKEWIRLKQLLVQRGPSDLVDAFNKYMIVLARSQHDTYTMPFEISDQNMIFGLDIVTTESLFGYEPRQLNEYYKKSENMNKNPKEQTDSKLINHENMLRPKLPIISFPKYNNFIQDKNKFDKHTKIYIPLEMLGISMHNNNNDEVENILNDYRTIISYSQYKDAGSLYDDNYDETISRRWGVNIKVASPVLSLAILIPNHVLSTNKKSNRYMNNKNEMELNLTKHAKIEEKESNEIKISVEEGFTDIEKHPEIVMEVSDHTSTELDDPVYRYDTDKGHGTIKRSADHLVGELDRKYEDSEHQYKSLGSPHLNQPIKLQMWLNLPRDHFNSRSNPQCVRWNSFTNSWTRLGCNTEIPEIDDFTEDEPILINCLCNHISNYAVIVDVIDINEIPEPSLLVQITSYTAFLISLPMLFCVIVSLALLKGAQTNSNSIHQNLIFCIFTAEFLFFISWQARQTLVENEFSCKLIAILLHFSWLAAFSWTSVDCVHLYRMLTEMRDINHGPMGFYFSLGYGTPALLVGLSVGVRVHEYGNNVFCWLSVYESVIWWLVGPIAIMSAVNLIILFVSVKAAFTLKDHVLGFGNLRTLLWLSVVSLPFMGIIWVLSILSASENYDILRILLSIVVILHAVFSLFGYCIINRRVRENLHQTFMKCMGRKVPLLDSSLAVSSSSQNIGQNTKPSFTGTYDRRNIGISTSSTTSRSTAKTSSSPYRSDGQLRNTSTSTSYYNSNSDVPTYMKGYDDNTLRKTKESKSENHKNKRTRKDSESGSESDAHSLELASSHSSDDDESRIGRNSSAHRSVGVSSSYLPNITEHNSPPELNVIQNPQLFPNINNSRWLGQVPARWSQETNSDNEVFNQKQILKSPDLTDTSYLHQSRMNMPPSILENIQEDYNISYDDYHKNKYDLYQDYERNNYGRLDLQSKNLQRSDGSTQSVNHMRFQSNYMSQDFEKSRTLGSPYLSKDKLLSSNPTTSHVSVQSLLKDDYQLQKHSNDYHDGMSDNDGSDKNPYIFPYTAEEDQSNNYLDEEHVEALKLGYKQPDINASLPHSSAEDRDKDNITQDDDETTV